MSHAGHKSVKYYLNGLKRRTKYEESFSNLIIFHSFDEGLRFELGQADKFAAGPECR